MLDKLSQFFADHIERKLGIVYSEHNLFQLDARLQEVVKKCNLPSVEALYELALRGAAEPILQTLLDVATNNETSFFRDPKVFRAIESIVLPELCSKLGKDQTIRVWSAASSYGQEPYSLAMLLTEATEKNLAPGFQIAATDFSPRALERAKRGVYSQLEIQRGMPAELMVKYFSKTVTEEWSASPSLQSKISFGEQNLKEPFRFSEKFHIILCRNVLIYQSVESKKAIVEKMAQFLEPGGYFIMGAGESMLGISDSFEQVPLDGAVFFRTPSSDRKSA